MMQGHRSSEARLGPTRHRVRAAPRRRPRGTWPALQIARAAADLIAIVVAFVASYELYTWAIRQSLLQRAVQQPERYFAIAVLFGVLALFAFWVLGLYRDRGSVLNLWEYETAVKGLALAAACFFAVLFFLRIVGHSRLVVVGAIGFAACLVLLERRLLSAAIRKLQVDGRLGRRALIYGCGATGRLVMKKIVQSPHLGCTVVGFLDDAVDEDAVVECRLAQRGPVLRVPVLGRLDDLSAVVASRNVDELFVTAGTGSPQGMREIVELAAACGVGVAVVPRLGDMRVDQVRVEDLGAVPVLRPRQVTSARAKRVLKRGADLVGAVALGIVTLPLWIGAWVLLRLEGGGPVLFAQQRVGLEGRPFRLLKFRTMRSDVDPYAPAPASDRDPRITRTGRFLRYTGLDELPQLANVLRGEMSLVGPRPEMPFLVDRYGPLERQRLRVKPGITGLWQVSADRQAEIHENVEYDLYYVSNQSLVLDALILLETVFFTMGLVFRALGLGRADGREAQGLLAVGPGADGAMGADVDPRGNGAGARADPEGYVLVALDQRRSDAAVPVTWAPSLSVAAALARRWPVKVLAAASNRAALDRLFAEVDRGEEWEERRTSYVPYRTRAELRELALGARLVLTDLAHVAEWARGAPVSLIWAAPEGLRWVQRNGAGDGAEAELSQWVDTRTATEVAVP